jgi:hypothetical protein
MQKVKMTITYSVRSEAAQSKTGDMQIFAPALEEDVVEYLLLMERKQFGCIRNDVIGSTFQSAIQNKIPNSC